MAFLICEIESFEEHGDRMVKLFRVGVFTSNQLRSLASSLALLRQNTTEFHILRSAFVTTLDICIKCRPDKNNYRGRQVRSYQVLGINRWQEITSWIQ